MNEIWKPVLGFEGLYEVSNRGRVRSLDTLSFSGNRVSQEVGRRIRGRVMRSSMDRKGYLKIGLYSEHDVDGKRKKTFRFVHRLVAEAFLADCPNFGLDVNHIDFNPKNNSADNLEWVTRSQNLRHSALAGRMSEGAKRRKYSSEMWAGAIKAMSVNTPIPDISLHFGIPESELVSAWYKFKDLLPYVAPHA